MNTAAHYYLAGMGSQQTAQTVVQLSTVAAGAAAPIALGTATAPTALGSSVAAFLGVSPTLVLPIVGAAIAGISIAVELLIANSGCGYSCIVTSQWANQAAAQLDQNLSQYFAIPGPRPKSVQQIAMANFHVIWNKLVEMCSQPGLSTAGKNCIADRQDGACKWKALPPAYPGEPAEGACWNWWNGYYYPIANDANVVDDTATSAVSSVASSVASSLGLNLDPTLLLILAAIGVVVMVAS